MPMVHNINEDDASTSKETEPDRAEPDIVVEFTSLMKKFANLKCIREYIKGHDIIYHNKLGKMSQFTSNMLLFYIDSNLDHFIFLGLLGMRETAVLVSAMTHRLDPTTCALIMCKTTEMLVEIKNAFNLSPSEDVNRADEKSHIFIGTVNQILDLNSRGELTFNTNEIKFIFVECDKILVNIRK